MPPELEIPQLEQPSLQSYCPQAVLDSIQGLACLVSPQLSVTSFSKNWNDTMARGGRNDLHATKLLNGTFLKLFADEEQQIAWRKLLEAVAKRNLDEHSQVVDFTKEGGRPFHLSVSVHPLFSEGEFIGYIVQATDASAEHVNRLAVLDRERKLKDSKHELSQLREQLKNALSKMNEREKEHTNAAVQLSRNFAANPKEFPEQFCRFMHEQCKSKFATYFNYHDDTQTLTLDTLWNAPEFYALAKNANFVEHKLGSAPSGICAAAKAPQVFNKLLTSEEFAPWRHLAEENNFNTIWAFPVLENGNLLGVLQLYFKETDCKPAADQQSTLSWLCDVAAPLLRSTETFRNATQPVIQFVEESAANTSEQKTPSIEITENESAYRFIAGGLAEEFSNLMTGVLGHSSLAASEMNDSHVAMSDIRAIERAARDAAKLTKRLAALSGEARKSGVPIELGEFVKHYSENYPYESTESGPIAVSLPVEPCLVHADGASLEVILGGMVAHAYDCIQAGTTFEWKLTCENGLGKLRLRYFGTPYVPRGWNEDETLSASRHRQYELFVSRESARALGGDVQIEPQETETSLCLILPLAQVLEEKS